MLDLLTRFRPLSDKVAVRKFGEAATQSFGTAIKIVSWNMYKGLKRGWLADLEHLATSAEIVLLQEAVLQDSTAHPFHLSCGLEWIMSEHVSNARGNLTSGPKTGSRVAASMYTAIRSQDTEPLWRTPKSMIVSTYPFFGDSLLVVNIHAINFTGREKFARQIEQIAEPVRAHSGPCVVAGDFNTWNTARWHILKQAMDDLGLARVPVEFTRWQHLHRPLDHIFYRGLRLMNAKVMPHIRSSDHIPLWAEFSNQ